MRLFTVEAQIQAPARTTGVLSRLTANFSSSPSATETLNSRVATANGSQVVSVSGSGVQTDAVNTDSVSGGQLINTSLTVGATGISSPPQSVSMTFGATSGASTLLMSAGLITNNIGGSSTAFLNVVGPNNSATATDGRQASRITQAGTAKNLFVNVDSNAVNASIALTLRKNATTDLAVTLSITALGTGQFEDAVNTASISANDSIEVKRSGGASGATDAPSNGFWLDYTSGNKTDVLAASVASGGSAYSASTANRFFYLVGSQINSSSTEANEKLSIGYNAVWSNLRMRISTTTLTQGATCSSRVNGSTGSQTFSITTSTGDFEDAVNTDTVNQADALTFLIVGNASITGSATPNEITSVLRDPQTESGSAGPAFAGIAFSGTGSDSHTGSGSLAFSGIRFAGAGVLSVPGSGVLAFSGISFAGIGSVSSVNSNVVVIIIS